VEFGKPLSSGGDELPGRIGRVERQIPWQMSNLNLAQ
jgi:hypothetical protein